MTQDYWYINMETAFILVMSFVLVPITLSFWFLQAALGQGQGQDEIDDIGYVYEISPSRWLAAIAFPAIVGVVFTKKKFTTIGGTYAAGVLGFITILASYAFFACLFSFAVSGSLITKVGAKKKKKIEENYVEGGKRNWLQVLANGAVACELSFIYILETGCRDLPVDFRANYTASWIAMAVLGALSCSSGDTFASELGSVFGGQPRLIHSWRKVPIGTNGGVTLAGLIFSCLGGLLVGTAYYVCLLLVLTSSQLLHAPPQWPVLIVGAASGLLGSCVDSYLGATLQYSGVDSRTGRVVECPSKHTKHVSGMQLLDNHGVNLVASLLTAFATPRLAFHIWWSLALV